MFLLVGATSVLKYYQPIQSSQVTIITASETELGDVKLYKIRASRLQGTILLVKKMAYTLAINRRDRGNGSFQLVKYGETFIEYTL